MCLSGEYFTERDKEHAKYSKRGYISIDVLEYEYNITYEQLADICLLKRKKIHSTADLHDYELTEKGSELFENTPYQLVLLKPNLLAKLEAIINDPKAKEYNCQEEEKKFIPGFIETSIGIAALGIFCLFSNLRGKVKPKSYASHKKIYETIYKNMES